jgi:hypothetical protein
MRLIWHFGIIAIALVVGFIPVLLNQESSAGNNASSKALQAQVELVKEERRRADALAQALAAAKLDLEASEEQRLALQQEHQRAVSLTAKLAQELVTVRQELEAHKQRRTRDSSASGSDG